MIPKLIYLRYWDSRSEKLRRKIFQSRDILIGSDKSCDFQVPEAEALLGRLDFKREEFENFQTGSRERWPPGHIFKLGSLAVDWRPFSFSSSHRSFGMLGFSLIGLLLVLIFSCSSLRSKEEFACPSFDLWLSGQSVEWQEAWQSSDRIFSEALRQKNFRLALAELGQLEHSLRAAQFCHPEKVLRAREKALIEEEITQLILSEDILGAARKLLFSDYPQDFGVFRSEILRRAEEKYWEAWRIDQRDSRRALELRREVSEICDLLRPQQVCFGASK
ncbi:MAG: hypothetical protein EA369_05745 [Bradymonadales bacterium]|nr:MAG: hypothetical protein EA369_05745 [Bradymonadales bacterium]